MSRFNVWVLFKGEDTPVLETYFNDNRPLASAYVAQRLSSQGWAKKLYIERCWIEEVTV